MGEVVEEVVAEFPPDQLSQVGEGGVVPLTGTPYLFWGNFSESEVRRKLRGALYSQEVAVFVVCGEGIGEVAVESF